MLKVYISYVAMLIGVISILTVIKLCGFQLQIIYSEHVDLTYFSEAHKLEDGRTDQNRNLECLNTILKRLSGGASCGPT